MARKHNLDYISTSEEEEVEGGDDSSTEQEDRNLETLIDPLVQTTLKSTTNPIQEGECPTEVDSSPERVHRPRVLKPPSPQHHHLKPNPINTPTDQDQHDPPHPPINNNNDDNADRVVVLGLPAAAAASFTDSQKKHVPQRLWGEDDEMALLKGLVNYASVTGSTPSTAEDLQGFHDFILESNSVRFRFTQAQLFNKLRKLKSKFLQNAAEVGSGSLTFSNRPHERVCYELSKNIWGGGVDETIGVAKKTTSKRRKAGEEKAKASEEKAGGTTALPPPQLFFFGRTATKGSSNKTMQDLIEQGLKLIGDSPSPTFVRKWNDLRAADTKLYLKRVALIQEQIELVRASNFYAA